MICIVCALDIEYDVIKGYFTIDREYSPDEHCKITECAAGKILIIRTGIGKELAGTYTAYALKHYGHITHVYSAGIAGALSGGLKTGDIVIGHEVVDYATDGSASEYASIPINIAHTAHAGKVLSANGLIDNSSLKEKLFEDHHALCVEMESAGVIKECLKSGITFAAVKVISDYADENAMTSIIKEQLKAVARLGQFLLRICDMVM